MLNLRDSFAWHTLPRDTPTPCVADKDVFTYPRKRRNNASMLFIFNKRNQEWKGKYDD